MVALRCVVLLAIAGTSPAQAVLLVPSVFPTIAAAIGAAQPGDVVLVATGTYPPFVCDKAITIEAVPQATVLVKNASLSLATTSFAVPAGATAKVVGLEFRNDNSVQRHATRVVSGTVAFENCRFEGEVYGDAGLRVDAAAVWLRACRLTGQTTTAPFWQGGNVNQCAGLLVNQGFVAAVDTEFRGGRVLDDAYLGAGHGILAVSSSLHCVRCTMVGGASFALGGATPNGDGLRVQSGVGTWLADCTLVGGSQPLHPQGGGAVDNLGGLPVHLTRCTATGGAGSVAVGLAVHGPVVPDDALGLAAATVDPLLGSVYRIDYLTAPNAVVATFLADRFEVLAPVATIESTWAPAASVFACVAVLTSDSAGIAVSLTPIPNVPALQHVSFWLHGVAWSGSGLHVAPPIGGVLR